MKFYGMVGLNAQTNIRFLGQKVKIVFLRITPIVVATKLYRDLFNYIVISKYDYGRRSNSFKDLGQMSEGCGHKE